MFWLLRVEEVSLIFDFLFRHKKLGS